ILQFSGLKTGSAVTVVSPFRAPARVISVREFVVWTPAGQHLRWMFRVRVGTGNCAVEYDALPYSDTVNFPDFYTGVDYDRDEVVHISTWTGLHSKGGYKDATVVPAVIHAEAPKEVEEGAEVCCVASSVEPTKAASRREPRRRDIFNGLNFDHVVEAIKSKEEN